MRGGGVVVNSANVSDVRMLPAIVVDNRAISVGMPGDVDHALDKSILARMAFAELWKSHALVDGHPRHNAGMVVVAVDGAAPLRGEALFRLRGPGAGVGHLFPDEQAQHIAPVEPTG